MAIILNIETSTAVCSVALSQHGKVIALRESTESNVHAEKLAVFIHEIMQEAVLSYAELDAIAVGTGPGSYTGLRIGTSTAKGLCYALDKPLLAIPTLQAMALAIAHVIKRREVYYCAMIDARRLEVYTGLYDFEGKEILPVEAKILDEQSFVDLLTEHEIAFAGDGMLKMKTLMSPNDRNCIWVNEVYASAKNMALLSEEYFIKKQFSNVAYYEPFYLKDFVAGRKVEPDRR
jgi:tRNA threonylcarbamoyladenosine biosynthesis protein TsaB